MPPRDVTPLPFRPLMTITHDEPGRLLILEGDDVRFPGGRVGGFVGALVEGLAAAAGPGASERIWHPVRFCVNREAGSLEIAEANLVTGEKRGETIPLSLVGALNVRNRFWRQASVDRQPQAATGSGGVDVTFQIDDTPGRRTRSLWMRVDGIDTAEEIADFAYRLGTAAGLSHQRVVQSDPRRIQIDLTPQPGPETQPMPSVENRASYARNIVIPAATKAAAEEIVPPFDSAHFLSSYKVAAWSPGDDIRFEKPLEKTAFGCLPVVLAGVLAGPAVFAMQSELMGTILASVLGLIAAFVASVVVVSSLPRRTVISWRERTITVGGWFARRQLPFDQLVALELRGVRSYVGSRKYSYNNYRCDIAAYLRGDAKPRELVRTNTFKDDPETPYDPALGLVTELARALGVERRVTDYD